jgi:hypothetical protein
MSPVVNKQLFLEQVTDYYIRENFRRLETQLKALESAGVVGPAGPQGDPGDPGLTQATDTGGAGGGTITGGNVTLASNRAVKYTVLTYNTVENVTKYEEIVVLNTDGTTGGLKEVSAFKFGSVIDYTLAAAITAGNLELTITNNELYDLEIEISQVLLGNLS